MIEHIIAGSTLVLFTVLCKAMHRTVKDIAEPTRGLTDSKRIGRANKTPETREQRLARDKKAKCPVLSRPREQGKTWLSLHLLGGI